MALVIISLDAAYAADADLLLSLPHLGRLAQEGVFCRQVQTIYPSVTYPCHASLLTGCYPDKHGIGHNEVFDPAKPSIDRAWRWESAQIKCDSLLTAARKAGRETAAILWPVTGMDKSIRYNFPEVKALKGENQTSKVLQYGSYWWLLGMELRYGRTRPSNNQPYLDDFATLLANKLIAKQYYSGFQVGAAKDVEPSRRVRRRHMPDILLLHLVDLDDARHHHGTHSEEAHAALRRLDRRVGEVIETLRERQQLDQTVFAVVSDHGHQDVSAPLCLKEALEQEDIPATIHTLGRGAYVRIERGDYPAVSQWFLDNQRALKLKHIYLRDELRALHAPEDIYLAVEADDGYEIVESPDETIHKATHGFGPHDPEAQVLLWLKGPMFQQNVELDRASLVDIAPTLAYATGLALPDAQGRVLREVMTY